MRGKKLRFRYGTPVTDLEPVIIPGSYVFDSATWVLYLDTEEGRKRVTDNTKLSLTGGEVTGTISVVDSLGTTQISLSKYGTVSGKYFEITGKIELEGSENYNYIAVVDESNRVRGISTDRLGKDLEINDITASSVEEKLFITKR